jgi:hypothetical protein
MLIRFASAVSVASPAAGLATVIALFVPDLRPEALYRLTSLWCIVPPLWGLWAMVAPRTWIPKRLPTWGAILGFVLGTFIMFVLNLPAQVLETVPPAPLRGLVVFILVAFYYVLWILVRMIFRALAPDHRAPATSG